MKVNKPSPIGLAERQLCTGCAACAQACAKGAISMVEDREGFLQPRIDTTLCVECHKCEQVCPIVSPIDIPQNFETKAYAAINKDEEVRMQSSSGGVFYALAKWTIEQGGVVFGARWDDKWEVMHDYAEDLDGVKAFMKSKYVQSRVGETYKQAKKFLNEGRWVLYSGTPCQIGGLHKFLGKDYDKLLMVDLICHGVPSPGVWRAYLKETTNGDKFFDIDFRDKRDGWLKSNTLLLITNNYTRREIWKENPYYRGFIRNVFLRNSCYCCPFRTYHRISDVTIADYWGVDKLNSKMFDDKGTSVVLVHSVKGQQLINALRSTFKICEETFANIHQHNLGVDKINPQTHRRKYFFRLFNLKHSFTKASYAIDKDDLLTRVVRKIKKFFHIC